MSCILTYRSDTSADQSPQRTTLILRSELASDHSPGCTVLWLTKRNPDSGGFQRFKVLLSAASRRLSEAPTTRFLVSCASGFM